MKTGDVYENMCNKQMCNKKKCIIKWKHCIKCARIRVFTDTHCLVHGQNLRFCRCTGEYVSVKTRILAYFMQ